jgi:hypothetical protein
MLRGECPVGGLRTAGFVTRAARFCARTGSRHAVTGERKTPNEQGACRSESGARGGGTAYDDGRCAR